MRTKIWTWLVLVILVIALGYGALVWYWQSHFEIRLSSWSEQDRAKAAQFEHNLDEIARGVKAGEIPWRIIDYSSVGFPDKEAELLELRREVDVFNLKFGRLPNSPSELLELFKAAPSARRYRERDFRRLARDCQVVLLGTDSYILNCDGWQTPERTDLERLVVTFRPDIEKFYLVEENLVLFVPSFVKGRPLPLPTNK